MSNKPALWELDLPPLWESFLRRRKYGRTTDRAREAFRAMLEIQVSDPDMVDYLGFCTECHVPAHDTHGVRGVNGLLCQPCWEKYPCCESCDDTCASLESVAGDDVCNSCRDNYYRYCESCDDYYHTENGGHDHYDEDCCEAPGQVFAIRNDGQPPLANDQRVTVTLPAGVISDEGLYAIATYLRDQARLMDQSLEFGVPGLYPGDNQASEGRKVWQLSYFLDELGNLWQKKEGNYTKRLSRFAYKKFGLKVPAAVISGVGNIASEHSRPVDFQIEVTRNLNLSAEDFANEDSCWWESYSYSRCTLKSNGGFGLRTFTAATSYQGFKYDRVTGRAWVMPLKMVAPTFEPATNGLVPTFETLEPDAFMVFNGYGDLEGYNAARILAHMAGMTYRKIGFECEPMYINSESGYLIAPEEIAESYTDGSLGLSLNQHSDLYTTEKVLINA